MLITCVIRNARAHKLQWSGYTVHSSTACGFVIVSDRLAQFSALLKAPLTKLNTERLASFSEIIFDKRNYIKAAK